MTLTPSTIRTDLKCGKGAIQRGHKCTKGAATVAENILKYGGAAGAVGSVIYGMQRGANPFNAAAGVSASLGAIGAGVSAEGKRTGNKMKEAQGRTLAAGGIAGAVMYGSFGHSLGKFNKNYERTRQTVNEGRQQTNWAYEQARRKAEGFGENQGYRSRTNTGVARSGSNPFKDLGVNENSSDDEIKKAWKELMRKNHPDVGGDPNKAKQYNAAYQEILRRRGKRDSVYADGFDIDWDAISL